jgi:hypothetical protein
MATTGSVPEAICALKEANMGENGIIDRQKRRAQRNGHGISVNVTDIGRRFHEISQSDQLEVVVHEDGIWIEPFEAGQEPAESD